jgi:glyceraldehyde 3-phosphate dehydrogenase
MLIFSERQNVSSDLIGIRAAVVIEGNDTHTRTGFLQFSQKMLKTCGLDSENNISMPVTHAKIFGWYDNEFGSYVNMLGKLAIHVSENM